LDTLLAKERVTGYIGFDPTASSLHVGSLLPIMSLARLQRFGHHAIAIVGGGTGLIGDPSGKANERQLLDADQVEVNLAGIRAQLSRFLDFDAAVNPARIVNNLDWLGQLTLIDFLRDTGKYFTVNYMLSKESVKRRIASEDGISYTEFTYMMLQAYDFLALNEREDCTLQLGGSDQWGNILAGADLVRRVRGRKVHGLVFPLVTNSSGTKFGKTESGTVWLDPERTSPYRFYQFWLNTDDRDVVQYLKFFTWLGRDEIAELESSHESAPEKREAHRVLAEHVTRMVHGDEELSNAVQASDILFGGDDGEVTLGGLRAIAGDVPTYVPEEPIDAPVRLLDLLAEAGVTGSKGEARRLIQAGGLRVNNVRIDDTNVDITPADFVGGEMLLIRKGKKKYHIVHRTPEGASR
ncbi:MAG: tyrosine--tRNA ligase, partial [Rhodothermales bacterium]|nr:tyrosine--tRNA ligase [Rhodothermales bacterium]